MTKNDSDQIGQVHLNFNSDPGYFLGHTDLPQGNGQKRDTSRIGTF